MAEQKRKPGQEEDTADKDTTDEAIEMPEMGIESIPTAGEFEVPKFDKVEQTKEDNSSFSDQEKAAFARGITGATPALMGLLFGASPATAENQIKEAQKYYDAGTPKKTVLTKGINGEPIYTDVRESIGKEAWAKPVKSGSSTGLKQQTYIDRATGEPVFATLDPVSGITRVNTTGEIVNLDKYKPAVETSSPIKYEGLGGETKLIERNKYLDGGLKSKTIEPGIGTKFNMAKQDVELGNKFAEKTAAEMKPYIEGKANVRGALNLLQQNPNNDNAIVQAAGIFKTAKIVVNERISDQERGFVTQAPGMLDNLANKIATGVTGAQRDQILSQMREILVHLDKIQDDSAKAVQQQNIAAYSGGDRVKAKYLSDRMLSVSDPVLTPKNPTTKNQQVGSKPQFTREQWDALPESKKRQILGGK